MSDTPSAAHPFEPSKKINGKYQNTIETNMDMSAGKMLSITWRMLRGVPDREPGQPLPTAEFDAAPFTQAAPGDTLFSWFGHSSVLVRFAGKTILFDPVFSPRASMFSFAGPKNFGYRNYMQAHQLPKLDRVVLSHDHYDHLDRNVIQAIHPSVPQFYVPLGVKARLVKWGVPAEKIKEFGWWQKHEIEPGLEIVCTPSRHFSGRGLTDRASTLWCSWVFLTPGSRFYFSGDSGYSPDFKKIGDTYGPFDFAFMECGQYNHDWEAIHMMPEQTVQAALDVQAKLAIPIHWGKFALALHAWTDPVVRFRQEADRLGLPYFFPQINAAYTLPDVETPPKFWWE